MKILEIRYFPVYEMAYRGHLAIVLIVIFTVDVIAGAAVFDCNQEQLDDDASCYRVSTLLEYPYVMLADNNANNLTNASTGINNDKSFDESKPTYQGFLIDYLDELARIADFRYQLRLGKDKKYGHEMWTTENSEYPTWNGLIGELIRNETDIALAPITVTTKREEYVDFTTDFENFEAVVVFSKRPDMGGYGKPPLKSLEDLINSAEYRYGVKKNGALQGFLQSKDDPLKRNISAYLDQNPLQPITNEIGLARVQQDKSYAFIVEEPVVRSAIRRPPCLLHFPTNFYKRRYSLAVRKHSPLREIINAAHMSIVDSGSFERLFLKWWGEDLCSSSSSTVGQSSLFFQGGRFQIIKMTFALLSVWALLISYVM